MLMALGSQVGDPGYDSGADFNGDGVVGLDDWASFYACYFLANPVEGVKGAHGSATSTQQ